jgi:predicted transcriptional regulator
MALALHCKVKVSTGFFHSFAIRQRVHFHLRFQPLSHTFSSMTDKEMVMQFLHGLPENASMEEITEELAIVTALRRGREDVVAGRVKTHAEVERLMESWPSQWNAK